LARRRPEKAADSATVKLCVTCHVPFDDGWTCPSCGWAPTEVSGIPCFAPDLAKRDEGFEPDAFELLAAKEGSSFWFRGRNRLILDLVTANFPDASSAFEVGCGTGFVLRELCRNGFSVTGSDLHPAGLAHARRRIPDAELLQIDARTVPFQDEFDVVGAFDVLEHIREDDVVLQALHRAVKPGGGLVVSVPQHPRLWSPVDDYAHHVRRYRRKDLIGKVEAAGFEVLRVTSFVFTLLPLMALSRVWRRGVAREEDPAPELALPGPLNRAFEWCLDLERACIMRGVSFPAGGSLFLVAQRPR